MIDPVINLLRCPRCRRAFTRDERTLRCGLGHAYDVARQGYVNLTGAAQPAHADTSAMVAARAELLDSGRYAALVDALLAMVPAEADVVLDVGTGTGHYGAATLHDRPGSRGIGLDVSVAACRRAARAHPRLGVVTADAWTRLPVADHVADVILSVFSPRNADEFVRLLRPGGSVITITPRPDHLVELRMSLGLLAVEEDKGRRLADVFGRAGLGLVDRRIVDRREQWTFDDAVRSVLMGPNAFHSSADDVRAAAGRLDWPRAVTLSCMINRWQRDRC